MQKVLNTPLNLDDPQTLHQLICQECGSHIVFDMDSVINVRENRTAKYLQVICPTCDTIQQLELNTKIDNKRVNIPRHNNVPV